MAPGNRNFSSLAAKIVLSIGVSAALLALLIHSVLSAAEPAIWPGLVQILAGFPAGFVGLYILAALIRTLLQGLRYRLLLKASEQKIPTLYHLLLVTVSRNMFVDMLPARLGELSYIAMLNRGYRVSPQSCISSLAISFVFDLIALGLLLTCLVLVQLLNGGVDTWLAGVLVVLAVLIVFLLLLLFPVLGAINRYAGRFGRLRFPALQALIGLLGRIETALRDTRTAGLTLPVLGLSVGIRVAKYLGLYGLFIGAASVSYPGLPTDFTAVLAALVSAEAGASLPIPAFMGFGTYEAGGLLALVALGAGKATSLIVMLAIHAVSQVVDYLLGGLALLLFLVGAPGARGSRSGREARPARRRGLVWAAMLCLLAAGAVFLLAEMRAVMKRGALRPPEAGSPVSPAGGAGRAALNRLHGFVVWSSNRGGNHDIYLCSLPDLSIRRVTSHPHTEYYPRISPDGRQVVFARSQEPWVSQRNVYPWDIWLIDLASGAERLVAKNGTVPTWSADGRRIFFQRHGTEVVEYELAAQRERVVFKAGDTVQVPPETLLETPDVSRDGKRLAVTLRGPLRATAIVGRDGKIRRAGNGCQLNWGPADRYLYTIDHGGKMQNALYRIDPDTLTAEKWFDAPGQFSHEYFPRVANTGDVLVYGASRGDHEHDRADYEIFIWVIGTPAAQALRLTHHTGNDCWPDIHLFKPVL